MAPPDMGGAIVVVCAPGGHSSVHTQGLTGATTHAALDAETNTSEDPAARWVGQETEHDRAPLYIHGQRRSGAQAQRLLPVVATASGRRRDRRGRVHARRRARSRGGPVSGDL